MGPSMDSLEMLRQRRQEILALAEKHGAYDVRVFGSIVRHEDTLNSDIDFLVKRRLKTSPWFPAGLMLDLQKLLGRPIDIVTESGLNPHLREYVIKEAEPL